MSIAVIFLPVSFESLGFSHRSPILPISGFDDDEGFFIYTHPSEGSELSITADFYLNVAEIDAKLLYFLNLYMENAVIEFGAGIFVDIDKEAALGKADGVNSLLYGRVTRDIFRNKIKNKKNLFQICAAAAAGELLS